MLRTRSERLRGCVAVGTAFTWRRPSKPPASKKFFENVARPVKWATGRCWRRNTLGRSPRRFAIHVRWVTQFSERVGRTRAGGSRPSSSRRFSSKTSAHPTSAIEAPSPRPSFATFPLGRDRREFVPTPTPDGLGAKTTFEAPDAPFAAD